MFYATLWDGSLVFASTAEILARALKATENTWFGSHPQPFESMMEGEYFHILDGSIITVGSVSWKRSYTSTRDYSAQTSGGKSGFTTSTTYAPPATTVAKPSAVASVTSKKSEPVGSEAVKSATVTPLVVGKSLVTEMDDEDSQHPAAKSQQDNDTKAIAHKAIISNLFSNGEEDMTDEEYETFRKGSAGSFGSEESGWDTMDDDEFESIVQTFLAAELQEAEDREQGTTPKYYITGHDGDEQDFMTTSALMSALVWESGVSGGENHLVGPDEGNLRWVNQIMDIGSYNRETGDEESWVTDEGLFMVYSNALPSFVRDGVHKLRQLVGA